MKITMSILFVSVALTVAAQTDKEKIERACLDYLEGFYEGDTLKLARGLKPSLYKFGYWKSNKATAYEADGQMTYRQAMEYAKRVLAKKSFAKPDVPKTVEVLDVLNHIAAAKVTAWWGYDYLLLSRAGDCWVIEQVLWEGPLSKP